MVGKNVICLCPSTKKACSYNDQSVFTPVPASIVSGWWYLIGSRTVLLNNISCSCVCVCVSAAKRGSHIRHMCYHFVLAITMKDGDK